MSATGQYRGSEAYGNVPVAQREAINPNTGTLTITLPIIELRGIRESIDLTLNVTYNPGSIGIFGLPGAWGFRLPYIIPNASATIRDRTYIIDFSWSDSQNYKSGLKYLNDHGVQLQLEIPASPLPSGKPGSYTYRVVHGDGSVDYFDALGRPIEHDDLFGNNIYYSYVDGGSSAQDSRLAYIQDSWGQEVQFQYQGNQIMIIAPDQGKTTLSTSENGVVIIEDPIGMTTTFGYQPSPADSKQIVTQIQYPTGLLSLFGYVNLPFIDLTGATGNVAAVQSHLHLDSANNTLDSTSYAYGSLSSNHTYTGASAQSRMGGLSDNLMDFKYAYYFYDVRKTELDGTGKPLAATTFWYNHLHLLTEQINHTISDTGALVDTFRVQNVYVVTPDQHALAPSYNRPVQTTLSRLTSTTSESNAVYQPMLQTSTHYNEFGNTVSTKLDMYEAATSSFMTQKSTATTYAPTNWNGHTSQMAVAESYILYTKDDSSGQNNGLDRQTQHTLSADQKTIIQSAVFYVPTSTPQQEPQPWKTYSYEYDQYGRILKNTISWSTGASSPQDPLLSATMWSSYTFDSNILMVTTVDALQNASTASYDMRVASGPVISSQKALGQVQTFEYDLLGRVVKHIDFLGGVTTTINPSVNAPNNMTVTDPFGHIMLTTFDPLGRPIQVNDNGDPTAQVASTTRMISQTVYDFLGQRSQTTDMIGVVTNYSYDALKRPLTVAKQSLNSSSAIAVWNTTSYMYDDVNATVTESINTDLRSVTTFDGQSRPVQKIEYPDSQSSSGIPTLITTTHHDGDGKVVHEVTSSRSPTSQAVTVLTDSSYSYNVDAKMVAKTVVGTGSSGTQDTVSRLYSLDLFGNKRTYTKTTTYGGSQTPYNVQGPIMLYSPTNKLVSFQNQIGHQEQYEYDANSLLSQKTLFDGTVVTYQYDAAGQVNSVTYPSQSTQTTYLGIGRKASVTENNKTISYTYTIDGTLQSTTFEDRSKQLYALDQFSRVVTETDIFGMARNLQYDIVGNLVGQACQNDHWTLTYGIVNHTNGQLVQISGKGSSQYTRCIAYDGFGHINEETTTVADGTVLLQTGYTMDAEQRIVQLHSSSQTASDLNFQRELAYDGIGQLVQDTIVGSSPTVYSYDGNSNVLSVSVGGRTKTMNYNAIDQRADAGFQYDTNGCMISDDSGVAYTFDIQDRLLTVQLPGSANANIYSYHPDDLMASFVTPSRNSSFSYDSQKVISTISTMSTESGLVKTSFLTRNNRPAAVYSDVDTSATYLLDQNGSTALLLDAVGGASPATIDKGFTYQAYGVVNQSSETSRMSTASNQAGSHFKFHQEYSDKASGLMYLRSRFYDPAQMVFISMDTVFKENRYAFCGGDPINYSDPSGYSPIRRWVQYGVGIPFSIGVATGVFALTNPVTAAIFGAGTLSAVVAGAFSGAVANVATGAVVARVDRSHYYASDALRDGTIGALGGAIFMGSSQLAQNLMNARLANAAGAMLTAGVTTVVEDHWQGQPVDWRNVMFNAALAPLLGAFAEDPGNRYPRPSRSLVEEKSIGGKALSEGRTRASTMDTVPSNEKPAVNGAKPMSDHIEDNSVNIQPFCRMPGSKIDPKDPNGDGGMGPGGGLST